MSVYTNHVCALFFMAKTKNFDSFIQERQKDAPSFTIFDKEYKLAPSLPYSVVLQFKALQMRDANDSVGEDEILSLFEKMIGKSILTELSEHPQFDIDTALNVMSWIFEVYGLSSTEEKPVKKARTTTR